MISPDGLYHYFIAWIAVTDTGTRYGNSVISRVEPILAHAGTDANRHIIDIEDSLRQFWKNQNIAITGISVLAAPAGGAA